MLTRVGVGGRKGFSTTSRARSHPSSPGHASCEGVMHTRSCSTNEWVHPEKPQVDQSIRCMEGRGVNMRPNREQNIAKQRFQATHPLPPQKKSLSEDSDEHTHTPTDGILVNIPAHSHLLLKSIFLEQWLWRSSPLKKGFQHDKNKEHATRTDQSILPQLFSSDLNFFFCFFFHFCTI